jgi:hypothetical protein
MEKLEEQIALFDKDLIDNLTSQLDFADTARFWSESFATPAMNAWWSYEAPRVRDVYAGVPGGFYSADRVRGVAKGASDFYGSLTEQLSKAFETQQATVPATIETLLGLGPAAQTEQKLNLAQEANLATVNPYLTSALQAAGAPTMDWLVKQKDKGFGLQEGTQIASLAAMLLL